MCVAGLSAAGAEDPAVTSEEAGRVWTIRLSIVNPEAPRPGAKEAGVLKAWLRQNRSGAWALSPDFP